MSVDEFFTTLKDGTWHNIRELSHQTGLPANKLIEFSKFLFKQGIAKYEEKNQKIKIEASWKLTLPEDLEPPESKTYRQGAARVRARRKNITPSTNENQSETLATLS